MCGCLFQLLSVSAIVLANLCVSYIMTSQNEEVRLTTFSFSVSNHQYRSNSQPLSVWHYKHSEQNGEISHC